MAVGTQARFPICNSKKALHPLGFGEDEITSVAVSVQPRTAQQELGTRGRPPSLRPCHLPLQKPADQGSPEFAVGLAWGSPARGGRGLQFPGRPISQAGHPKCPCFSFRSQRL